MLSLAVNGTRGPIFLKDIAQSEEISEKYLSQIIIPLKSRGLVNTFRGAHGGYTLGKPASEISLREIVESLEGELCLVDCIRTPAACRRSTECVTREIWDEMSTMLLEFLDSHTLEDLIKRYMKKRGLDNIADFSI